MSDGWKVYEPTDVKCPTCGVGRSKGCVYAPLKYWDGTVRPESSFHSEAAKALFARVGTPMGKPHNDRKRKARLMTEREKRKFEEREYYEQFAASPAREEILQANSQAIKDEQEHLIRWLRLNSDILTQEEGTR